MSVNFGGGLPPAPNGANGATGHPQPIPQPQGQLAHQPVISGQQPQPSPLPLPAALPSSLSATYPALLPYLAGRELSPLLTADWAKANDAIRRGDYALVHRMLDDGLLPELMELGPSGERDILSNQTWVPAASLQDVDLIDRFIALFVKHNRQSQLYEMALNASNGIFLLRLVQGGVSGWQKVPENLERLIKDAIKSGDAGRLKIFFRIWKEHCPSCKIDWNKIGPDLRNSPSVDVLEVLTSELQPDRLPDESLTDMFYLAVKAAEFRTVSRLCEWLAGRLETFVQSVDWRRMQTNLSDDRLITLARGGFPLPANVLPEPGQSKAKELQLILLGPKLEKGAFANMLSDAPCLPANMVDFIYSCAFNKGQPGQKSFKSKDLLFTSGIGLKFFRQGLTPELSLKLAPAISQYLHSSRHPLGSNVHRLGFLACLNETINPEAADPVTDALSLEQAQMINTAVLEEVKLMFGQPEALFAAAIACIRVDGTIDVTKLGRIFVESKGLSPAMVMQMGLTLKSLSAEVMSRALPQSLFKPGMTGTELQQAFLDWIRQGVAQLIIIRLPRALSATIAKRDWNSSHEDSDDDAVAEFDRTAPLNYLATSVIRQYGEMLAENVDESSNLIADVCRALPADAFDSSEEDDTDDSYSEEQNSTTESEPKPDPESDSD